MKNVKKFKKQNDKFPVPSYKTGSLYSMVIGIESVLASSHISPPERSSRTAFQPRHFGMWEPGYRRNCPEGKNFENEIIYNLGFFTSLRSVLEIFLFISF
jgi:hypothetical protein